MDKLPQIDSPKLSANYASTLEKLTEAKKGAARLLGCYRTGDANDPETYVSAVVAVLSRFDVAIIRSVTDPVEGLASKLNWLPTVAEIRKECDILENRERRKIERDRQIMEQLEARGRLQITDQRPRKTYEQLVDECRAVGLDIGPKSFMARIDPEFVREKLNLTQEQWNAIPNAKGAT